MLVVVVLPCAPATAMPRRSARELAEQLGAVQLGARARAARALGVVGRDRRGVDDLGLGRHVGGVVADVHAPPPGAERLEVGRLRAVRAAHAGAQRPRRQRIAAHPGAADPDEVQAPARPGRVRCHGGDASGGCGRVTRGAARGTIRADAPAARRRRAGRRRPPRRPARVRRAGRAPPRRGARQLPADAARARRGRGGGAGGGGPGAAEPGPPARRGALRRVADAASR